MHKQYEQNTNETDEQKKIELQEIVFFLHTRISVILIKQKKSRRKTKKKLEKTIEIDGVRQRRQKNTKVAQQKKIYIINYVNVKIMCRKNNVK